MDELSIVALTVSLVALAATGFTLGMSSAALRRADDNEDSLDLTDDYVFGEDTDEEGNRCGGLIDRVADLETVQQQAREKAEAIALTASEIKARLVMEKTAKELIAGVRQELAVLQAQVAGMLVSREVLTPSRVALGSRATGSVSGGSRYGFLPDPLPEPTFQAAHASTDFDLTAPDADPETAEAQPQVDDDQATAVNDVQAVVDWDEAKRGEVA